MQTHRKAEGKVIIFMVRLSHSEQLFSWKTNEKGKSKPDMHGLQMFDGFRMGLRPILGFKIIQQSIPKHKNQCERRMQDKWPSKRPEVKRCCPICEQRAEKGRWGGVGRGKSLPRNGGIGGCN